MSEETPAVPAEEVIVEAPIKPSDVIPSNEVSTTPVPEFAPEDKMIEAVKETFTFHELTESQKDRQKKIFESAQAMALTILQNTKFTPLQHVAIQALFQAVTKANEAVSCVE